MKIRQDLGDEFADGYFAKKEEMYQHQLLLRQVADLIDRKEKRDRAAAKQAKKQHH